MRKTALDSTTNTDVLSKVLRAQIEQRAKDKPFCENNLNDFRKSSSSAFLIFSNEKCGLIRNSARKSCGAKMFASLRRRAYLLRPDLTRAQNFGRNLLRPKRLSRRFIKSMRKSG